MGQELSKYKLVGSDQEANQLIQQGQFPVVGSQHDDLEELIDSQWNSPTRIFGITKDGQPTHFPWEDLVKNAMDYPAGHSSQDLNHIWNKHSIPEHIQPMYDWEVGQGYIPEELKQKYVIQQLMNSFISPAQER